MSDVENLTVQHTATAPARPRVHGAAIAPGMRLGDFRFERVLGAGGMGEVYLATDLQLGRDVAIKLLPAGSASDGVERARLFHEAHVQARIRHANIGHIYAAGEDGGRVYFAMEYVDGETLAARVANGPLPIEVALDVVREAACGLAAALREGFMHRDIKPSNLMRDARGRVKVLDFGLVARVAEDGPVEPVTHGGTPRYMAPEQARRERVDQRADIYALGATLYHLAAGAPPFEGDADQLAVLHATAPRPKLPRGRGPRPRRKAFDRLCARMMAPQAADRFASYDQLLAAIDLASFERARPARPAARAAAAIIDLVLVWALVRVLVGVAVSRGCPTSELVLTAAIAMLAVVRRGRTPGKAMLDLETVDARTGAPPRVSSIAIRTFAIGAIPAAGALLGVGSAPVVGRLGIGDVTVLFGVAIVVVLLVASSRWSANRRALWDLVAGTMVRYRR